MNAGIHSAYSKVVVAVLEAKRVDIRSCEPIMNDKGEKK